MAKQTSIANELKEFNKEATSLASALQDVTKALKENAQTASRFTGETAEAYLESGKDTINLAKQLQGYTSKQLKNKQEESKFQKLIDKTQQNQSRTLARISYLEDKRLKASKEEQAYIDKALKGLSAQADHINDSLKSAKKLQNVFEDIRAKTKFFDNMAELVNSIPILSLVLKEFQKASDAAREAAISGKNAFLAGAKEFINALGKLSLGLIIGKAVGAIVDAQKRTVQISRQLGVSNAESAQLYNNMVNSSLASKELYFNAERYAEAQKTINESLGTNVTLSEDAAQNFSALVYRLGLSADEANKVNEYTKLIGINATDFTAQVTIQTKLLNGQRKIQLSNQTILKEISNASARLQVTYKAQNKSLINAAYSAKELGMNLSGLEKIQASLLNFEESISAELNAELLTGRNLNLERARFFALSNNIAGVAEELKNQNITATNFGQMNYLQQEAIAGAFGMQASELAESLRFQEQISKLSEESGYRDAQSLEDLKQKILLKAKEKGSIQEALTDVGDEELRNQLEALTIEEQMNEKIIKEQEKLIQAIGPEGLQLTLDTLNKSVSGLITATYVLAAAYGIGQLGRMMGGSGMMGGLGKTTLSSGAYVRGNQAFSSTGMALSGAARNSTIGAANRLNPLRFRGAGPLALAGTVAGSMLGGVAGNALTGASLGSMFGPYGALIGGVLGAGYGLLNADDFIIKPDSKQIIVPSADDTIMGINEKKISSKSATSTNGDTIMGVNEKKISPKSATPTNDNRLNRIEQAIERMIQDKRTPIMVQTTARINSRELYKAMGVESYHS